MSEGGEARSHEAEVEAAIFDVLAREGVTFGSRFPIGRSQVQAFRYRVAKAIAALDAVRRSPQGEDQACGCGAKPGQPCYVDADGPQYHALRGVPQGEDHEAGIEAATASLQASARSNLSDAEAAEFAIAAYLSRCPSPERDTEKLEELIRNLLCAWLNRWEPGENQDIINEAERRLAEFSDASNEER